MSNTKTFAFAEVNTRTVTAHSNIALHASLPTHHTILVAEDHEDTRFMLCYALRDEGYRVLEAASGTEAIEIATRETPDLILMDLTLPGLDGLTATLRIRENARLENTPIIALSGHDPERFREAAFAAGCSAYLYKPVSLSELKSTLKPLLQYL